MNYCHHIKIAKLFILRNAGLLLSLWLLMCNPFTAFADTKHANITISATLLATCITSSTQNVGGIANFGTINFGAPIKLNTAIAMTGQENSGAIQLQCSKGTKFSVTLSGGNSGNSNARYLSGEKSRERVAYNLYSDPTFTTLWDNVTGVSKVADGTKTILPVYALIPVQPTPIPDLYTDIIQVMITW